MYRKIFGKGFEQAKPVQRDEGTQQSHVDANKKISSDITELGPGPLGEHQPRSLQTKSPQQAPIMKLGTGPENQPSTIMSYGQQLKYERELEHWSQEELAEKIGIPVSEVKSWEAERSAPDFFTLLKLSQILGNDFYLSSEVSRNRNTLRVRIVQRQLTGQSFTVIIAALTELHAKLRLKQENRIDDLIEYTLTQDSRFVEEANLVITELTSNSPALITMFTDPHVAATVVTSTVTLAVTLQKAINVVAQTITKLKATKRDIQTKETKKTQEQLEIAITTTRKLIDELYPNADPETKATMMQAMLPNIFQLLNGKGLKFALPAH